MVLTPKPQILSQGEVWESAHKEWWCIVICSSRNVCICVYVIYILYMQCDYYICITVYNKNMWYIWSTCKGQAVSQDLRGGRKDTPGRALHAQNYTGSSLQSHIQLHHFLKTDFAPGPNDCHCFYSCELLSNLFVLCLPVAWSTTKFF